MSDANTPWIVIGPTVAEVSSHLGSSEQSLLVQRTAVASYQRPLIATDLEQADAVLPALCVLDDAATIVVLSAFRIPYSGLHMLPRKARLEDAIEQTTNEGIDAFIRSTNIDRARFTVITRRGDIEDHVRREIEARRIDLLVLAMKQGSMSTRRITRMVGSILDAASCDVLVIRSPARGGLDRAELLPSPPW